MLPTINVSAEIQKITSFIRSSFEKAGFSRAVIGLSGGVDSATSLALVAQALGIDNVYPVLMPYGALSTTGVLDAMTLVTKWKVPIPHITRTDIRPVVDLVIGKDSGTDRIRTGNIMSRVRMVYLFDQAKKRNALVVGTENKSEYLLGYFTRFGDEASDVEPLRNLYKTQVYELARYLGIPEQILLKNPTADLWVGQTDEGEFGFSYKEADEILHRYFDKKESREIIQKSGFEMAVIEKVLDFVSKNGFKRDLPLVPPEDEKAI